MLNAAIYNVSTGKIRTFVSGPYSQVDCDTLAGEEFFLNCPADSTHIISGVPTRIEPVPTLNDIMARIRADRNRRLSDSDWTQLPDVQLNSTAKGAWAAYRQQLRDFPEMCDPYNPVWPVSP